MNLFIYLKIRKILWVSMLWGMVHITRTEWQCGKVYIFLVDTAVSVSVSVCSEVLMQSLCWWNDILLITCTSSSNLRSPDRVYVPAMQRVSSVEGIQEFIGTIPSIKPLYGWCLFRGGWVVMAWKTQPCWNPATHEHCCQGYHVALHAPWITLMMFCRQWGKYHKCKLLWELSVSS